MRGRPQLTSEDYEDLLAFRTSLRRFLHWSETQARAVSLTPAQHQLLLAIKGHQGSQGPAVGDLAWSGGAMMTTAASRASGSGSKARPAWPGWPPLTSTSCRTSPRSSTSSWPAGPAQRTAEPAAQIPGNFQMSGSCR
jgi:hypothetical protein